MYDENEPLLIQLDPRGQNFHISGGRTVLVSARDGSIDGDGLQGLWTLNTRLLSRYRWEVGLRKPTLSVLSAVEQNRSIGYFIFAPTECHGQATHHLRPMEPRHGAVRPHPKAAA